MVKYIPGRLLCIPWVLLTVVPRNSMRSNCHTELAKYQFWAIFRFSHSFVFFLNYLNLVDVFNLRFLFCFSTWLSGDFFFKPIRLFFVFVLKIRSFFFSCLFHKTLGFYFFRFFFDLGSFFILLQPCLSVCVCVCIFRTFQRLLPRNRGRRLRFYWRYKYVPEYKKCFYSILK